MSSGYIQLAKKALELEAENARLHEAYALRLAESVKYREALEKIQVLRYPLEDATKIAKDALEGR